MDVEIDEDLELAALKFASKNIQQKVSTEELSFKRIIEGIEISVEEEQVYRERFNLVISGSERSLEDIMRDYELVIKDQIFTTEKKKKDPLFTDDTYDFQLFKLDHPGNPIFAKWKEPDHEQVREFETRKRFIEHFISFTHQLNEENEPTKKAFGFPKEIKFNIYDDMTIKIKPNNVLPIFLMVFLSYFEYELSPVFEVRSYIDEVKVNLQFKFQYFPSRKRLVGFIVNDHHADYLNESEMHQIIEDALDNWCLENNVNKNEIETRRFGNIYSILGIKEQKII